MGALSVLLCKSALHLRSGSSPPLPTLEFHSCNCPSPEPLKFFFSLDHFHCIKYTLTFLIYKILPRTLSFFICYLFSLLCSLCSVLHCVSHHPGILKCQSVSGFASQNPFFSLPGDGHSSMALNTFILLPDLYALPGPLPWKRQNIKLGTCLTSQLNTC